MTVQVIHADCRAAIPELVAQGVKVDAIVTDPPYGLKFMGKHWDDPGAFVERRPNREVKFDRVGGNHNPCNSADVARTRRVEGVRQQEWHEQWARAAYGALKPGGYLLAFGGTRTHHRIWCAIEDAGFVIQDTIMWLYGQGFPKGRTQLKPAVEPICVAYNPGGKRVLQIDECRVPGTKGNGNWVGRQGESDWRMRPVGTRSEQNLTGRWPANLCHDGSDEVMEAFAAFGERKAAPHGPGIITPGMFGIKAGHPGYLDAGTAARFFFSAKADAEDRWGSRHPTVKPVDLIKHLVALHCPPGGLFLDCFAGSGTAGVAALATGRNAILIEEDATHIADIRERLAFYEGTGRHSLASKNRNRREGTGTLL